MKGYSAQLTAVQEGGSAALQQMAQAQLTRNIEAVKHVQQIANNSSGNNEVSTDADMAVGVSKDSENFVTAHDDCALKNKSKGSRQNASTGSASTAVTTPITTPDNAAMDESESMGTAAACAALKERVVEYQRRALAFKKSGDLVCTYALDTLVQ